MTDSNYTQQDPEDAASAFASSQFQINQTLAKVRTMVIVQVMSVTGGAGAIAAPATVSVKPLVKIVDGNGNASSHGSINNIPVFRYGSGNGAVICDPVVNDIGWMAVADRDSSVVVKTKAEAQPGSKRKFNLADGIYMGSILSGVPAQCVTFTENGVSIKSGSDGINLNGLVINQDGQVEGNLPVTGALELAGSIEALNGSTYAGNIQTSGDMIAGFGGADQVGLQTHVHVYLKPTSAPTSAANTNSPTAGT